MAKAFGLSPYQVLLDVGVASGAHCLEAVRRYPGLQAMVLDRPGALAVAREKIAQAGYADRIRTHAGDFLTEELPPGADVMLLSMILHDRSREKNRAILQKCFRALPSGGAVIVSELMMDDEKTRDGERRRVTYTLYRRDSRRFLRPEGTTDRAQRLKADLSPVP